VTRSLNEVSSLTVKAARGAGFDWGVAAETGPAVAWLHARGVDGCAALAAFLVATDGVDRTGLRPRRSAGGWRGAAGLCPVHLGLALSDHAHALATGDDWVLEDVIAPVLVLPFAAALSAQVHAPLSLTPEGGQTVTLDGSGLAGAIDWPDRATLSLRRTDTLPPHGPATTRPDPDADGWAILTSFAHRTYAPATEASRSAGAGPGDADTD
jgi:hypothetical protein